MSAKISRYLSGRGWTIPAILGAMLLVMALAACGADQQPSPGVTQQSSLDSGSNIDGDTTSTSDYTSLSGDINVDGSSTVFPIAEAVAEEFGYLTNGQVRVTVGVSGTGGGFKKFCNGEIDISDASRPIRARRG